MKSTTFPAVKGANFWVRRGSKYPPAKFQSDDVIVESTRVKLVKVSSPNFGERVNIVSFPNSMKLALFEAQEGRFSESILKLEKI